MPKTSATRRAAAWQRYLPSSPPYALERPVSRSYESLMKRLTRYALVILNKFSYVPLDVEVARQLFNVISARYGRRSIVFAINIALGKQSTVFGDEKLAAVIDRAVHHTHLVEFNGPSSG